MAKTDSCISFYLQKAAISGQFCRVSKSITNALIDHSYPHSINKLLAEMTAVAHCLTMNTKSEYQATMQLTGAAPVRAVLVDLYGNGLFRCCASFEDRISFIDTNYNTMSELFGNDGKLLFNMNINQQQYQTLVPLQHSKLEKCFQDYFDKSEQIPALVMVASKSSDAEVEAASLILHRIPGFTNDNTEDTNWETTKIFTQTIKPAELMDSNTDMEKLIKLVYNEFNPSVSRETTISFRCKCSEKKFKETLLQLEISEKFAEVICEYCNKKYNIDITYKNL
jgi:molecular chaperone Hsp33